ncbi:MAG: hypothetical protein ACYCZQ_15600 [Burkholderiales bacterium]
MGTGQGDVSRNHQLGAPVHFTWKSTDGGQGECQLSGGRTINATFDPS